MNGASGFGWLHLTDIHVGVGADRYLWANEEERMLNDLRLVVQWAGPINAVFFTGDLTQRGQPKEFDAFTDRLERIMNTLRAAGSNPVFLAVPGNHDLVRPRKDDPILHQAAAWDVDATLREEFWAKQSHPLRKAVRKAFQNWTTWWELRTSALDGYREGLLPGDYSLSMQLGSLRVGVIGLNSSFLQLGAGSFEGKLALDARQAASVCDGGTLGWAKKHDICFLLTHHPPKWLTKTSQVALNNEILPPDIQALHLFGHDHEGELRSTAVGGGAPRVEILGRSLFGLEWIGDTKNLKRMHGYSAGRIWMQQGQRWWRLWPRLGLEMDAGGGWQFVPDGKRYKLSSEQTSTNPVPFGPSPLASNVKVDTTTQDSGVNNGPPMSLHAPDTFKAGPLVQPSPAQFDPAAYRLAEVDVESAGHLASFTGRGSELASFSADIAAMESGYFLLVGPAGQGKSALAVALAAQQHATLHMVKSHPDPLRFLPALTAALSELIEHPPSISAFRGSIDDLRNGFVDALTRLVAKSGRALVVIDAIDEAVGLHAEDLSYLPPTLPQGAVVVLTCRPTQLVPRLRLRVRTLVERQLGALSWGDFRSIVAKRVGPRADDALGISGLRELYDRMRGNGLLCTRVVELLESAWLAGKPLQDALADVPVTLDELFAVVYEDVLRAAAAGDTIGRGSAVIQAAALAVEPMLLENIASLMSIALGKRITRDECRSVCKAIGRYLIAGGEGRISLWHQGFADYVRTHVLDEEDVVRWNEAFCVWARTHSRSEYSIQHRILHLVRAGMWDEARETVLDPAYLRQKVKLGRVASLVQDLNMVLEGPAKWQNLMIEALRETLRSSLHVLIRHPECLYQELYNRLRWHDARDVKEHWIVEEGSILPWETEGRRLSDWIQAWTREPIPWLESIRPVAGALGDGQVAVIPTSGHGAARIVSIEAKGEFVLLSNSYGREWMSAFPQTGEVRSYTGTLLGVTDEEHRGVVATTAGLRIVDVRTGDELGQISIQGLEVNSTTTRATWEQYSDWALDPNGTFLCHAADSLCIWSLDRNEIVLKLDAGRGSRWRAPRWGPSGRLVVVRELEKAGHNLRRTWASNAETCLVDMEAQSAFVIGGDFCKVAFDSDGNRIAVTSIHEGVKILDARTRVVVSEFGGEHPWIEGAAFSPDGALLATGGHRLLVWEVDRGRVVRTFGEHLGLIRSVAFFPDGRHLASTGDDETLRLWSIEGTGGQIRAVAPKSPIADMAFSPDGAMIALHPLWEHELQIWSAQDGTLVTTIPSKLPNVSAGVSLLWAGLDRVVGADGDGGICIWDVPGRKLLHSLMCAERSMIDDVAPGVHPDSRWIAVPRAKKSEFAEIIRLDDGVCVQKLDKCVGNAFQFAWTEGGRELIASGTEVVVLDGRTGEFLWRLPGLSRDQFYAVATTQHGRSFCVVGNEVEVWSLAERRQIWTTKRAGDLEVGDGKSLKESSGQRGIAFPIGVPVFSQNGARLVVHRSLLSSSRTKVYDASDGTLLESFDGACDPIAVAESRAWRVVCQGAETKVFHINKGCVAWGPAMERIAVSPQSDVIAGAQGHQLYILKIREE